MSIRPILFSLPSIALFGAYFPAHAQCPAWRTGFGAPGLDRTVISLSAHDLGSGPELYAGGDFTVAGGVLTSLITKWDGASFTAMNTLSGGLGGQRVHETVVFDSGSGPELYACGGFNFVGANPGSVGRWNGSSWTVVGGGDPDAPSTTWDLVVFDDGSGPALFAAGHFNLHKWNGSDWTIAASVTGGTVRTLEVIDDGSGAALFAGGGFTAIASVPANGVARWDGSTWTALGAGVAVSPTGEVFALAGYDDGSGFEIYAGGLFSAAGGNAANNLASWNGSAWSSPAGGVSGGALGPNSPPQVRALRVHDDGSGAALYVGGTFALAGAVPAQHIARWDGSSFTAVGGGVSGANGTVWPSAALAAVYALEVFDEGSGPALFVGGTFAQAGARGATYLARWDGSAWSALASGHGIAHNSFMHNVVQSVIATTTGRDEVGRPVLALGGDFQVAGDTPANRVALWNGLRWDALGSGVDGIVHALAYFDDGSGACSDLYAAGAFLTAGGNPANRVARWDGASWSALSSGMTGTAWGLNTEVRALAVFDDGSGEKLFATGNFTHAGGAPASSIAKWNGAAWSNVGSIGGPSIHAPPYGACALLAFDDGNGSALYVAGNFNSVGDPINGSQPVNNIARWDGAEYTPLGAGLPAYIRSLVAFDDGSGPALYAASGDVHKWDGASWSNLNSPGPARVLAVFDDGSGAGPQLYVGLVSPSLAQPAGIARWNGASWEAVDGGLTWAGNTALKGGDVFALQPFEDESGAASLFAVGHFEYAGGEVASGIAAWGACTSPPGTRFCFGDGSLATACPCALPDFVPNPPAAIGHGCANSFNLDGAVLSGSGSTAANDVVLTGTGQTPIGFSFFFVGTSEVSSGIAVADGVRCAGGALTRFGSQNAVCGSVKYPNPDIGWTTPLATVSGTTPGSGLTKYYQVYYRNAAAGFCSAGTANLTSGYRIVW